MAIRIEDELKNDFLVYAKCVNEARSFPDARDGLKPSQRAALWEMYDKNYSFSKPHVKSAKITGGIIANWWPHGDMGAYQTLVRMSQPWVNNISEIDFHGANGSLIGGGDAASSRYTEARLSKASEDGFFANIDKKTVEMIPNFSEDMEWPTIFPAIFPRLFVNGSQGIGYTIAQEWEPGNLKEFQAKVEEYISNKKIDCSNIYPDYPTGGTIINKSAIHEIYETGKGSIILRAKTEITDNYIDILELPYQVYAEPLIQEIKDLVNNETIIGIEDICNMSDDKGLRIRIICSSDPQIILNQLYNKTDLMCTFSANQMALVNGTPVMLTLQDYIKIYIDHNIECIVKEYEFDLDKANKRLEIVSGLITALGMIDKIIDTIKKSKSSDIARENLQKSFKFTEAQAKAIVDMRLGRLANMEVAELEDEKISLEKIIDTCNKLLKSKANQTKEFLKRLSAFVDKYGWERRTALDDIDIVKEKSITRAATKVEEEFMIVLDNNHIKKIPIANYKSKNNLTAIKVGAKDKFILISETGIMYKLQANKFKAGSLNSVGEDLTNILNDRIINIFTGNETEEFIFFIAKSGLVKKMIATDVFNISKNVGALVMKLDTNDTIINIRLVDKDTKIAYTIGKKSKELDTAKFRTKGRNAGGVAGIKLKENQSIELN